jgi:hypothetical protein
VLDIPEPQCSAMIFGSVVKQRGDDHIFGNRETYVPGLAHDQGCNTQ